MGEEKIETPESKELTEQQIQAAEAAVKLFERLIPI